MADGNIIIVQWTTRRPMDSLKVPLFHTVEEYAIEIRRQSFTIFQIREEDEKVVGNARLSAHQ